MTGKTVLVTGASSGFGEMIALELARAGYRVYASMRENGAEGAAKVRDYASVAEHEALRIETISLDITDQASVDKAVADIVAGGGIDVVVHNAGHMSFGPVEAFTVEQLAQLYDVNALGAHRLNRAVLPHMRERGSGALVWISSSSVHATWSPYLGPYFAAKAAMEQLATAYAAETAPFGIETSIVVPGAFTTGTNHFAHATSPSDAERAAIYAARAETDLGDRILAATKRLTPDDADPAEVARAVRRIVDAPDGERPFRVTVDPSEDGSAMVAAVQDRLREETLHRIGLDGLLHPTELR